MDPALRVTVSIGIADCSQSEDTGNAFRRADEALYQAKQGGRNRCIAAPSRTAAADGSPPQLRLKPEPAWPGGSCWFSKDKLVEK